MSNEQKIRDIISENVERIDGNTIALDASLLDAGLDSLDMATVLLEVQETFDVTVPEGQEDEFITIEKLLSLAG